MMQVGINLFKQTDNLTESEPRMTSDWKGFQGGQLFEVPLHDANKHYKTVTTGLIRVQPEPSAKGAVAFIQTVSDPALPPVSYPDHATYVHVK